MSSLVAIRRIVSSAVPIGALTACVVGGGLWYTGAVPVTEIDVLGLERATEVEIRHLADVRVGDSLLLMDLDAALAGVVSHPWVDDASIDWSPDGRLRIRVREHESAMLLVHGGLYRISTDGDIFVRARSSDLDLPLLTGLETGWADVHADVARRVVAEALIVLNAVDDSSAVARGDLSEVHFDAELGFTLRLRNRTRIRLGFGDPVERLGRLDALVRHGVDLQIPHEIDLDMASMALVTPLST